MNDETREISRRMHMTCTMHAADLGSREGFYRFGPERQAGTPDEREIAWVHRYEEHTAFRYISHPEQSGDRAIIGSGTLEEAEKACSRHAHTGDFMAIESSWVDAPISTDDAIDQVRSWHEEAVARHEKAQRHWEDLPIADLTAAQADMDALVSRLAAEGCKVPRPIVERSPRKRKAGEQMMWWRNRRDVWGAVLADPTPENLWRALQIRWNPNYDIPALCRRDLQPQ